MARYPARLASRAWLALMAPMICKGDSSARAWRNRAPGDAGRVMGQSPSKTQTLARAPGLIVIAESAACRTGPGLRHKSGPLPPAGKSAGKDTGLLRRRQEPDTRGCEAPLYRGKRAALRVISASL